MEVANQQYGNMFMKLIVILFAFKLTRDRSHLTTMMWNFMSSGTSATPIPDNKKISCMVINVKVYKW